MVNSVKKGTYWSAVGGSSQAPLGDLRADGGLGFRTGVQAAGNTCLSSGTEASGMVLHQLFLLSMHQLFTHDSRSLAGGMGKHLDSHSSKTVHGSGERGGWSVGGKGKRCWVPRTTPPNVHFGDINENNV